MALKLVKTGKINWDQETTMRERVIFVCVLVAVFVMSYNTLMDPEIKKIHALKSDLRSVQMQIEGVQKLMEATQGQIAKQQNAPSQQAVVGDRVKKILERKVIDPTREINTVVDLLGSKTVAKKAEITNITVSQQREEKNYTAVPITIELKGRYGAIESYFKAIEDMDKAMIVKKFELMNLKDSQGLLSAKVDVELYLVKQ